MRAEQENWGNTVKERLFDQRGAVVVHWLILLNVVIFFLGFFFQVEVPRDIYPPGRLDLVQLYGAYSEYMCFHEGELWRLFTYQFLHANLGHILFNMIALWFFGPVVEERFGHLRFLLYYLFCGVAAALFSSLLGYMGFFDPEWRFIPMVGASGSIYGIMAACAVLFPHARVQLLFPPVNLSVRQFALVVLGIACAVVIFQWNNAGGEAGHLGGMLAGALWGCIPGLVKAFLNINEVLACIMTNWVAANLVTWMFDISNFKNTVENTKSGYIYKTSFNGVATPKLGLDKLFPGSQVNAGILVAILLAIAMYILMTKTTLGYELQACGANRHAARYAGIKDKRNIVLSMAIAGALAGAGAALYYLSGNTEFYWSTYQSLPAVGFNGIPVALLALNNPIAVIFAGVFMAMLKIVGQQLTNLTAYNEYITDVIIAVIVYLSAFSLVIRMMLSGRKKKKIAVADTAPIPRGAAVEDQTSLLPEEEKAPVEAAVTDSDNAEGGDQA